MGFFDKLLGEYRSGGGDQNIIVTPGAVSEALFDKYEATSSQTIINLNNGNFYNFTTGDTDMTCQIGSIFYDTEMLNVRIRVRKADLGSGIVEVLDTDQNVLETLHNQGNWVDILWDGTNYILM